MATFSKQLWEMVKNSSNVQDAIKLFTVDENFDLFRLCEYLSRFNDQSDAGHLFYTIERILLSADKDNLEFGENFDFGEFIDSFKIYNYKVEKKDIVFDENGIPVLSDKVILEAEDFRGKAGIVDAISTFLFWQVGFFKPIVPSLDFNMFQKNCDILGIELPEAPHTKQYVDYLIYFADICDAIQKWQDENELSEAEACACIYEVACRQ